MLVAVVALLSSLVFEADETVVLVAVEVEVIVIKLEIMQNSCVVN